MTIEENILNLMAYRRGHHTPTGNFFYWDPIGGNDANDGLTKAAAKLTWGGVSGVNSLVVAHNHDTVFIVPGEPGGETLITEQIDIDKEYTFLSGPGRDVKFIPTNTTNGTMTVSALGVEISGLRIQTAATGDGEALVISADFCSVHEIWVEGSRGDGIKIQNALFCELKDVHVRDCDGNGVVFRGTVQDCMFNTLSDTDILNNGGDGVLFTGSLCSSNNIWGGGDGVSIVNNGGWGVNETSDADSNHILGPTVHIHENASGEVKLIGGESGEVNITQWATSEQSDRNAVLIERGKGQHTWSGNVFYVDPFNGDTAANGADGSKEHPLSTVQECIDDFVVNGNHDVIKLEPGNPSGTTVITEALTIPSDRRYVFINGPGRDILWTRSGAGDTITIDGADGIQLSGFQLETAAMGSGNGVDVSGADNVNLHNLFVNETRGDGVSFSNCTNGSVMDCFFLRSGQGGSGQGINIKPSGGASNHIFIVRNHMAEINGDAIRLQGGTVQHTIIQKNIIHDNRGWGIKVENGVQDTAIVNNVIDKNDSGDVEDLGVRTTIQNNEQWSIHSAVEAAAAVWGQIAESDMSFAELVRIMVAVLAGKATATQDPSRARYRDLDDSKDRVDTLHSSDGDRTSVTLDGT